MTAELTVEIGRQLAPSGSGQAYVRVLALQTAWLGMAFMSSMLLDQLDAQNKVSSLRKTVEHIIILEHI